MTMTMTMMMEHKLNTNKHTYFKWFSIGKEQKHHSAAALCTWNTQTTTTAFTKIIARLRSSEIWLSLKYVVCFLQPCCRCCCCWLCFFLSSSCYYYNLKSVTGFGLPLWHVCCSCNISAHSHTVSYFWLPARHEYLLMLLCVSSDDDHNHIVLLLLLLLLLLERLDRH